MFVRDSSSGAIINTEDSYYKAIVARRGERQERQILHGQVSDLQKELLELKSLMQQVISGKKHG